MRGRCVDGARFCVAAGTVLVGGGVGAALLSPAVLVLGGRQSSGAREGMIALPGCSRSDASPLTDSFICARATTLSGGQQQITQILHNLKTSTLDAPDRWIETRPPVFESFDIYPVTNARVLLLARTALQSPERPVRPRWGCGRGFTESPRRPHQIQTTLRPSPFAPWSTRRWAGGCACARDQSPT